jgi:hypothetical protein
MKNNQYTIRSLLTMLAIGLCASAQADSVDDSQLLDANTASHVCYRAEDDIGSRKWLEKADIFYQALADAAKAKQPLCLALTNDAERKEARALVALDATKRTVILQIK